MKLTAETTIRDEADRLWHLTQEPRQHARWDLRHLSCPECGTDRVLGAKPNPVNELEEKPC